MNSGEEFMLPNDMANGAGDICSDIEMMGVSRTESVQSILLRAGFPVGKF